MPLRQQIEKKAEQPSFVISKKPYCNMDDVVVSETVQTQLLELVSLIQHYDLIFKKWGLAQTLRWQKGVKACFYGESGTGKTMAAHAVADSLQKEILCVDYAQIESKYVGETSKNIRELFITARQEKAVLLFDEADAMLSKRVIQMDNASDVSVNQTRSVLLNELEEFDGIVLFTTNFITNFDRAFFRRIPIFIHFQKPDAEIREAIWRRYIPQELPTDADPKRLSQISEGATGADIANAVLLAAVESVVKNNNCVSKEYFENAISQILQSKVVKHSQEVFNTANRSSEQHVNIISEELLCQK